MATDLIIDKQEGILAAQGIHCQWPCRGPILTERHWNACLEWGLAQQNWRRQWDSAVFSDKTCVSINLANRRIRVNHWFGTKFDDESFLEQDRWGEHLSSYGVKLVEDTMLDLSCFLQNLYGSPPSKESTAIHKVHLCFFWTWIYYQKQRWNLWLSLCYMFGKRQWWWWFEHRKWNTVLTS